MVNIITNNTSVLLSLFLKNLKKRFEGNVYFSLSYNILFFDKNRSSLLMMLHHINSMDIQLQ